MENKTTEIQQLDLSVFWRKLRPYMRRLWFLPLLLMLAGGGLLYLRSWQSFRPMYRSEAVLSVTANMPDNSDIMSYSYYYDNNAAQQAVNLFPHLLGSDTMTELLCQQLGTDFINGSINASSVDGTNFFVLTVTSTDPQSAYDILCAVMDIYPQISRKVSGEIQFIVSQAPILPTAPYNSFSGKTSALKGGLAGFSAGLLILFILAALRRTVLRSEDVKRMINLPCLAHIPNVRLKRRKSEGHSASGPLITRQESDSAFCEAFRLLRLKLLRTLSDDDKVILFTSSVPSEGKSSIATNIALTLAKDGKRILLVDADLRGPSVKPLLGITEDSSGLGDFLSDQDSELRCVNYNHSSLYLLAGDNPIHNPTPLLKRRRLKNTIASLRNVFDYIIIDTPPCTMMADAAALSAYADKIVYVIREDYARISQIYDGIQFLSDNGARLCGFVLNRTSAEQSSRYGYGYGRYGYGKKYGYGYGYGYSRYGYGKSKNHRSEDDKNS